MSMHAYVYNDNNARAYELTSTPNYGEKRNWNLNTFCPTFYQGRTSA